MKPIAIALIAAAVAAATSAVLVTLMHESPTASGTQAAAPGGSTEMLRRLDAMDKRNGELVKSLDDLRMQLSAREAPARVPVGEIEAAVQRALAKQGAATDASAADDLNADAQEKAKSGANAASLFAEFQGDLDWDGRREVWKRAAEAGLTDELVALFEKHAKDNPNDPKAQVELGQAYLQKTFSASDGPDKGLWSTKADNAFDAAIAIDDHNWEARFTKGVNLSFWPPVLGKQNEAIAQFQTLVEQQEGQVQQPQFAQTHLWLGNMYQQMGQKEKAIAAWQHGLTMFPGDEQLQHQVEMAQQH